MESQPSSRSSVSSTSYTFSIPANLIRASVSGPHRTSSSLIPRPPEALLEGQRESILGDEQDTVKRRTSSLRPEVLQSNVRRPSAVRTARSSRSNAASGRSASVAAYKGLVVGEESTKVRRDTQLAGPMDVLAELPADAHVQEHGIKEPPRVYKPTISFQIPDFSGTETPASLAKFVLADVPPEDKDTTAPEKVIGDRVCFQDAPRRNTFSRSNAGAYLRKASVAVMGAMPGFVTRDRQSSIKRTYERAKLRQQKIQRSKPVQLLFEYAVYFLLLCFTYFVLVGRPLWGGAIWYAYILIAKHLTFVGGSGVFLGIAFLYAYLPLLTLFETQASAKSAAGSDPEHVQCQKTGSYSEGAQNTALLIPCYKSASLLPATLDAAVKVFPKENIFILANGNSPTPLDETESVCTSYGVNHTWIPVGSKIVAQYVGCYVSKDFPYALLIDDDCLLPPDFPVVTDRFNDRVKSLGYTITSTGPNHSKGTYCQQAQDLEYKLSGLQRLFAGKLGSATFAHGAIVLWDRDFLLQTFKLHPGFSISEDWFFGHVARCQGSRIPMCSAVFVETETPATLFFSSSGASRGGFGEMTVFKQRFKRWNFFFVFGMWYDMQYILCSWNLRPLWYEFGAKVFVFQEVYETLLYLFTPIVLPISFAVRPLYTFYLLLATVGLYLVNAMIFNEIHLRLTGRMVNRVMLLTYYMPFKLALTFVNVGSCYWSIWQYAKYFSRRHARIIEDDKAVGVVLKVAEEEESGVDQESSLRSTSSSSSTAEQAPKMGGRRMTVTAVIVGSKGVVVENADSSEKSTAPEDSATRAQVQETEGVATTDFAYSN
ncbi:hypothetical protein LTR10_022725 [Elasticomyces elasticus]|uniref:Glycosyltransferase 2-like domain-containing protein n=1 Tax=Exophiala sideris TaxID=1016849 RepID=A0ABR0IVI5_9EURO|nr:hypothetical protein LTR10_022725 [Elasticomyces elasticus]KAK5021487.1 hypothetical protein LTS07_010996 [Exophiala sideris]KAK5024490.1 hypothetical protein LTR13_010851 [Exophiala sideris]KAK5049619.1 hypothetical protein LTR69_011020 [Exophiala sideris]KAK5176586.1 hypothetical protein LTR44_010872 [Eurotiomycetes sp. CCFEE 6388]